MQGMLPLPSTAPAAPVINLEARQTTGQLTVPVNKSQLLHVDQVFGELSVGNQAIADVVPLTRNLIHVLGKTRGATNLTISDPTGNVIAVVDPTLLINGRSDFPFPYETSQKPLFRLLGPSPITRRTQRSKVATSHCDLTT